MREAEFDIRLTAGELFAFTMHHTYSSASGLVGLGISIGSLVLCAARYKYFDSTTIIALVITGLLFTVVQPVMLYFKSRVQVKKNESINDDLHYRISEEGIEVSQGEQQAFVKWYEVRKRKMVKNAMYLYMSPVRAFIFPESQCGGSFKELSELVKDMMEKYKDYEPEEEELEEEDTPETEGKEE
ncbi:MAG: YcxB family protein [Lachnospiraceae bacterium]|nr:YcxB family protein [Lachnospiraceae bacterium]